MRFLLPAVLLLVAFSGFAQIDSTAVAPKSKGPDFAALDSLYREDQFYFSFTYNILTHTRALDISQNKFSAGFSIGFLRDMPINDDRTVSIAAGLGYALQNFNYNLIVNGEGVIPQYELINDSTYYEKNKLSLNYLDIPIEFRWRNSTMQSHKFWRIYTGFKFSYLFNSRSKFVGDGGKTLVINNDDLNKFRYGVYVAAGYNTWNLYVYYGLNPIFKEGILGENRIDMSSVNVGLMFYIL
ncbi:MAG: PorT family protein [Flavobacterium sp.]|uniref:porin family protein n=1 Tax=Flavobacterium sp. TaxID=239 RepID=UPI00120CE9AF|nr:porin family protein [Flavobacterium sp.]RZJ68650.1 MAG: PorT family protein [Flavobacterium sp.]